MAELTQLALDLDAVEHGAWFRYPGSDIEVRIASTENEAFLIAQRTETDGTEGYRTAVDRIKDRLDGAAEVDLEAFRKTVIVHLVKDWKNIQINAEDVPYSPEKALEVLTKPEYRPFYNWIWMTSNEQTAYIVAARNGRVKNLQPASTGSPSSGGNQD